MNPGDLTVEVTTLSPRATEEDVYTFFAFCGEIEHIEIIRSSEYDCTAYVPFKDPYAPKTAVLLCGSFIVDQQVGISMMRTSYMDESDPWNMVDRNRSIVTSSEAHAFVSSPGEAVTVAQEVVKTMVAKGYVLGKDALVKAKALDESYKVSSNVAAKVADMSNRMGLTNKINAGIEVAKSIDGKYHVVETTKMAACYTGQLWQLPTVWFAAVTSRKELCGCPMFLIELLRLRLTWLITKAPPLPPQVSELEDLVKLNGLCGSVKV